MIYKEIKTIKDNWKDVDNLFRLDNTGRLKTREGVDAVVCGVENVILTRPGERVMRPDFGCYAYRYLYEPLHPDEGRLLGVEIIRAVNEFESRAEVNNIDMEVNYRLGAYIVKLQLAVKDIGETVEVVKVLIKE